MSKRYYFHVNVFGHPFSWTWEQAADALQKLPRMIFELDGSWIWSGEVGANRWQIDGHLYDFDQQLYRVELHGSCPPEKFDELLGCFGWPEATLTFEQVKEGSTLEEEEFRSNCEREFSPSV